MPTKDPDKRRKQNCENQKRWRERQTHQLHNLQATLEERNQEVENLQQQLRSALDEVKALRKLSTANDQRKPASADVELPGSHVAVPPELAPTAWYNAHTTAVDRGLVSFPNIPPLSTCSSATPEIEEADDECGIFGQGPDRIAQQQPMGYPYADGRLAINASLGGNSIPRTETLEGDIFNSLSHHDQFGLHHPTEYATEQNDDTEDPDETMTLSEMIRESLELLPSQKVLEELPFDPRFLYDSFAPSLMMGGTSGIGQLMMTFPDDSALSKHISTVQMVIYGNFPLLRAQPLAFKERVMAETFAWMLHEAWPSSRGCLKMIAAYQNIFAYELFRNFPCKTTYRRLHHFYRPTLLQLAVPHSPAIDWLPWPALRNHVILLQQNNVNNINIDELCMKALEYTVIEPEPSRNDTDPSWTGLTGQVQTTFRIWDMYLVEKAEGGSPANSPMKHHPASPTLHKLLQMYKLPIQKIENLRIDQPFYQAFPNLILPPGCKSTLQTASLNPILEERLQPPYPLQPHSILELQQKVQSMVSEYLWAGGYDWSNPRQPQRGFR